MLIIKKVRYLLRYLYQNLIYPKILDARYRMILKKNRSLKNAGKGQRCFILGNGPSIAQLDLTLLKKEQVFVVNDFVKHPQFEELNPANYVMSDSGFFNTQSSDDYFGKNLQEKSEKLGQKTKLFLNIVGKEVIESRKLFPNQDVYYLSTYGHFSEYFGFNTEIDRTIPFPKNVILACLMIAVYMGFETIYLSGVEHDFLAHHFRRDNLEDPRHIFNIKYFYGTVSDNASAAEIEERKLLSHRSVESSYESEIARVRQLFKNYRLFYKKVQKQFPKIKIYNATPNSFLDVFPYANFKDIKF